MSTKIDEANASITQGIVAQTSSVITLQRGSHDQIIARMQTMDINGVQQREVSTQIRNDIHQWGERNQADYARIDERLGRLESVAFQRTTTTEGSEDVDSDALSRAVRAEILNIISSLANDVTGSEPWKRERFSKATRSVADEISGNYQRASYANAQKGTRIADEEHHPAESINHSQKSFQS
jgi:hypothetical protein